MKVHSLYIHIPFCRHRCAYCDFNTYAGLENLQADYVQALCREMKLLSQAAPHRIEVGTIYFGGGTPSLLSIAEVQQILETAQTCFTVLPSTEITLEANPGTVSLEHLQDLRKTGINRLSMGAQSAHPEELKLLEREHDFFDVIQAVSQARRSGFENINLDLIFGLPYQTMERWQNSLRLALQLKPDHLSLYSLTLEHGTPMNSWVQHGLMPAPDADLAAEMYEWATAALEEKGFFQYEISNWARKDEGKGDFTCKHNLQYWLNRPYLGIGAGAHGFSGGTRTANVLAPAAYIRRCQEDEGRAFPLTPATVNARPVDRRTEMQETMMMGLRLTQRGVSNRSFQARFGEGIAAVFKPEVRSLMELDLLEWVGEERDRLRLTEKGRLLGNQVFMQFV